eukprot:Platyproteum_vivax@DN14950_c0_g1_i1.p1
MAKMFRREGEYFKHRVLQEKTGMDLWIRDLRWRTVNWHYERYMTEDAAKSLRSNAEGALALLKLHTVINQGEESQRYPCRTRNMYLKTFLPQNVPWLRTSNPFCTITPNKTGWKTPRHKVIPEPRPRCKHEIGGTNSKPPIHPAVQ